MNLRGDSMKYDHLVVFIQHDSTEIWVFRYGIILGLGTTNIMARTGIFGLIVVGLKRFNKVDARKPSMFFT